MDVSLVATLVGAVAAVVAVPVAVMQLWQGRKRAHERNAAMEQEHLHELLGSALREDVRGVLPPPVGRLPKEIRGRAGILQDLAELARRPDGHIHVLAGLGGSGKSTIALGVAREAAAAGLRVWWVAVADPGSVTSMLVGLARKLGAPDGEASEALAGRLNPSDVLWPRLWA
jgi:Mrp family chromosome partitioning ATPase